MDILGHFQCTARLCDAAAVGHVLVSRLNYLGLLLVITK